MPEAFEAQQLPNEAKIFAKSSLPWIRIIFQLCITHGLEKMLLKDMFLFVFCSGMHRSVFNQSQKPQGWKFIGLILFRLAVIGLVRWTLFLHPPRNSDSLHKRNVGNNRHIFLG